MVEHETENGGDPRGGSVQHTPPAAVRRGASPEEATELFRVLVETIHDYAIFVLDRTGHIITWSPGAERIKGYAVEDVIGRHFSIFYPDADRAWDKPGMELEVASREGRFEDEGWRLRQDGTRFWANVIITALRNDQGEVIGFAKVTRDLTERRRAEERAVADARRVAEAEAANRAKGEFLAAMSHELRTPLNAIGGYVDLLLLGVRGPLNAEQVQDLERVRHSQQYLLGIINDLLDFSRIEAGRISYQIEAVPIGEVLDAVHAMVTPQAEQKSLALEWPHADPWAVVQADRAKVEQILLNLLTNAIRYTDEGHVRVALETSPANVTVLVSDSGIGIPADKLEMIFEPFVQVGCAHDSQHEGTGLGLAISHDLARAMDGVLSVESEEGVGSTFRLTLPRAAEATGA